MDVTEQQKKTPKKRVVAAKKKSTPKPIREARVVRKKAVVKRPVVASTSARDFVSVKKPRAAKKILSKKSVADTETVTLLSGSLSLRLAEKRELYERWYQKYAPKVGVPLARYTGYTFVLLGIITTYLSWSPGFVSVPPMPALLSCAISDESCTAQKLSSLSNTDTPTGVEFKVVELGEMRTESDTNLRIETSEAEKAEAVLISLDTNTAYAALVTEETGRQFSFALPTATVPPGLYLVKITATNAEKISSVYTSAPVSVGKISPTSSAEGIVLGTSTEEIPNVTPIADATATTSETEVLYDATEVLPDTPVETSEVEAVDTGTDELSIRIEPGVSDTIYKLTVVPLFDFKEIEIYAIRENSLMEYFLGMATDVNGYFVYCLETMDLPAGEYDIIARPSGEQEPVIEARTVITVKSPELTVSLRQAPESEILLLADSVTTTDDSLATSSTEETDVLVAPVSDLTPTLPTLPIPLLTRGEQQSLAQRYRSAVLTQNLALLRLIDAAMAEEVALRASTEGVAAVDIQAEFDLLKASVVSAVDTEIVNGLRVIDTDRDGIIDADEIALYGTDPEKADSDADGVIDGIEIMRGGDPRTAMSDQFAHFNLPQLTNVLDSAMITIESVRPLYSYVGAVDEPTIKTAISGVALPHSFVTVYVFSDPILTPVLTDADGRFELVLEKELPLGKHEVYAALLDETGAIVVRSAVFSFEKTVDEYAVSSVQSLPETSSFEATILPRTQTIVGSMGLICFGLILVLLANQLTSAYRKPEEMPAEKVA